MRLGGVCLVLVLGCTVEHIGLLPPDGSSAGLDASSDVGFNPDVPGMDAAFGDAGPNVDAGPGFDAGSDSGPMVFSDVGPTDVGFDAGMDAGPPDVGVDAGPPDVGVDADVCTTGPDTDMDGVSDVCDRCAGEDDSIDLDGDGLPDACDPWPCSDLSTPPGTVRQEFIEISNVRLGDGSNRTVTDAGATVRLRFDYTLNDTGCVGCPNQIELGSQRSGRIGCIYDGTTPAGGVSSSVDLLLVVGEPGVVELRFNLGRNNVCAPAAGWWPMAPGPEHTFALLCVR